MDGVKTTNRSGIVPPLVARRFVPNPLPRCSEPQFTPEYLQFTYIQALQQLVASGNSSTLVLPFSSNLTPQIVIPSTPTSTPTSMP